MASWSSEARLARAQLQVSTAKRPPVGRVDGDDLHSGDLGDFASFVTNMQQIAVVGAQSPISPGILANKQCRKWTSTFSLWIPEMYMMVTFQDYFTISAFTLACCRHWPFGWLSSRRCGWSRCQTCILTLCAYVEHKKQSNTFLELLPYDVMSIGKWVSFGFRCSVLGRCLHLR